jgi:hypothetical protein
MPSQTLHDLCDEPLVVIVHRGAVVLNGPGNVALAMTVDAAELLAMAAQRARRGKRSGE